MKKKPTVSILMSTYNGSMYIEKQIESIKNQNFPFIQVSIIDDHSTDDTVNKVRGFIEKNDLTNWHLQVNSKNMGWRHNFFELLYSAKTDYVFFADQDDIWNTNKVSRMVQVGESISQLNVLVSDYVFFGDNKDHRLKKISEVNYENDIFLVSQNIRNLQIGRDGCAFMIKGSFVSQIHDIAHKIPVDSFGLSQSHDLACWLSAVLNNSLFHLKDNLIAHRMHQNSAWSEENSRIDNRLSNYNKKLLVYYQYILDYVKDQQQDTVFRKQLAEKIRDINVEMSLINQHSKIRLFLSVFQFSSMRRYLGTLSRVLKSHQMF
ncbi:glycosyltransferase [Oenococcus alcoholitolerans]|uniref:glycosyltransferase n=1 Tax=Oenococcus alcoholitolerans TaxID=931074 RepID=UPI003F6F039D